MQELAEEMTLELLTLRRNAMLKAIQSPNTIVSIPLEVKAARPGDPLNFGTYTLAYTGLPISDLQKQKEEVALWLGHPSLPGKEIIQNPPTPSPTSPSPFREDYTKVKGVSEDFVVRPFQFKGIASNERNFVKDALNFHFGALAVEKSYANQFKKLQDGTPFDQDEDVDGHLDEVSVGNVTALTIFTMSLRVPVQVIPKDEEERKKVSRGRVLFTKGPASFPVPTDSEGQARSCAACHVPRMRIYSNVAVVDDPCTPVDDLIGNVGKVRQLLEKLKLPAAGLFALPGSGSPGAAASDPESETTARRLLFQSDEAVEQIVSNNTGLSSQRRLSAQLPVLRRFQHLAASLGGGAGLQGDDAERLAVLTRNFGNSRDLLVAFNLTTLHQVHPTVPWPQPYHEPPAASTPTFTQNRLEEKSIVAGKHKVPVIDVPLFSDLRRHAMGVGLQDDFEQETDVEMITVPKDQFLTRSLWGVADTAPFMHDGRALSLRDAIFMHGSDGSEAKDLITHLHPDEIEAIVAFLSTLRLPADSRYSFDEPQTVKHTLDSPVPGFDELLDVSDPAVDAAAPESVPAGLPAL